MKWKEIRRRFPTTLICVITVVILIAIELLVRGMFIVSGRHATWGYPTSDVDYRPYIGFANKQGNNRDQYGHIDCICNNAAASKGIGPVEDYSLDDVQSTLDLTFTSLWKCLQGEIKILKGQSRPASIVNISSNSAIKGYAFNSIYAASKAAVNNLTQSVAKELARNGIRVNAVSPGTINTPGVRQYFKQEPKAQEMLENSSLLRRIGEPEEIGEMVAFLLSDSSSYITGQIISVDGGASIN